MPTTQIRDGEAVADDAKSRLNETILLTLMRSKGIKSIAELSRRSKVSRATIFRLKAGEVSGHVDSYRRLAKALDTTVETLTARSGS